MNIVGTTPLMAAIAAETKPSWLPTALPGKVILHDQDPLPTLGNRRRERADAIEKGSNWPVKLAVI